MERDSLEALLARGLSLAEIGRRFDRHEATVAYWVSKYGLQAVNRSRNASRGGLRRENLEPLVKAGASVSEIAERLGRSKGTVRHWLARYELKTLNRPGPRPTPEAVSAKRAGLTNARMKCPRHGETEFWLDGRGCYRCKICRSEAVVRRRRKVKLTLVEEAGGACVVCGYAANMRGLHFHHIDPSDKRFEINARGLGLSLETLRAEAKKCVLLCGNCHAEMEDGMISLDLASRPE